MDEFLGKGRPFFYLAIGFAIVVGGWRGYEFWLVKHKHNAEIDVQKKIGATVQVVQLSNSDLFVKQADGKAETFNISGMQKLYVGKLYARQAPYDVERYFWGMESKAEGGGMRIAYFAIEPERLLRYLEKEMPGLDMKRALKAAKRFEQDPKVSSCVIWDARSTAPVKASVIPPDGCRDWN